MFIENVALSRKNDLQNLTVLYQNVQNEDEFRVMFVPSCPAQEPTSISRNPPYAQPNQVCRNNRGDYYCTADDKMEMDSK